MLGLDLNRLIEVPFLERGRDENGWDCLGCITHCARIAYGIEMPDFDDRYEAADVHDPAVVGGLIESEIAHFEPGPAGPAYPLLTYTVGGFRCHIGLALLEGYMIHADRLTRHGGTFVQRYDQGYWAAPQRGLLALRPPGWQG